MSSLALVGYPPPAGLTRSERLKAGDNSVGEGRRDSDRGTVKGIAAGVITPATRTANKNASVSLPSKYRASIWGSGAQPGGEQPVHSVDNPSRLAVHQYRT